MSKKFLILTGVVLLSAVGLYFNAQKTNDGSRGVLQYAPTNTTTTIVNDLRVIYFDVGQGDSALIITPKGETILVDGGPTDAVLSKLGQYLPYYQKNIDKIILTHPHADHLEGLIPVLERFQIGQIYYSGATHTTDDFIAWLKLIKEKNIPMHQIKSQEVVELDSGVKMEFLFPDFDFTATSTPSNLNNTSIVFRLVYGQNKFLFMGDAEIPLEKYLLYRVGAGHDLPLQANVLKVAHHGSNSSTSEEFLKAVQAQMAVISVGKDNDFGHPHLRTLRRLERFGIKIFRTDEMGDIELRSDGVKVERK